MASDIGDGDHLMQTSYVFVRVLGKGAFGEAILYRKTDDNSLVVWKEVNLARLTDKARRDAQTEIEILPLLNHANIVSYYNHFVDEDTLFIEMEYANGGTLHDKISQSMELFPETEAVWYLFQVTSAVSYVHHFGIIHRDIKTLNIFMTKVGLLKLGDFGISKILESKGQMAESVVGTPYYMSPEIVKGERYNFKSDIWALGCVLYEILTLTRTFDASNPLKLACDIVQSEHQSIDPQYSPDMQALVDIMLSKDPDERPTAEDILKSSLLSDAREMERKVWELNSSSRKLRLSTTTSSVSQPVVTSKMCEVYQWGGGKITPQKLELFTQEKSAIQVATGRFHFAVITFEKELYTWANPQGSDTITGQLGHGDTASYKAPKCVDSLLGTPLQQVACGEDFTLCVSDEGILYGFGSNYFGCVGVPGEDEVLSPQTVDFFVDHPVDQVSCGDSHVVVLTRYGDVYTWGNGELGKLGLGSEDDFSLPQKVELPGKHLVREVVAGPEGTFLICASGRLLACGSNEFNKLGFNTETSGLRKRKNKTYDIPCKNTFTTVKPLSRHCITSISPGKTHSAAIDHFGHLFTFGSNRYGQLGLGDFRSHTSARRVCGVLVGQRVMKVACGDYFTVVTTTEKVLNSKTLKTQDSRVSISSPKGSVFELQSDEGTDWCSELSTSNQNFSDCVSGEEEQTRDMFSLKGFEMASCDSTGSSIPPWLQQELQEAEIIPLPCIDSPDYSQASVPVAQSQPRMCNSFLDMLVKKEPHSSSSLVMEEEKVSVCCTKMRQGTRSGAEDETCEDDMQLCDLDVELLSATDFVSCTRDDLIHIIHKQNAQIKSLKKLLSEMNREK
ncbi:serine/threonine-protein kinase Nek9-like isoform X3 [Pomacea canaliculata]|uniref:serine/threonine-protein kinase Nek9-like isoform X3 n=1 Tax=Pomacea canaliculata TaxID=400727 RepID=UPI000D72CE97|nr:serine/threonine-protein kinase Nek9-like isoform X3 [Pomacea canaliculata]